jgi:hypothetical protein
VHDTLLRLPHHDHAADALSGNIQVHGAGALNVGNIKLDLNKETGGLLGSLLAALEITLADDAIAVEAVNKRLGRASQLVLGHAPVLETLVGIAEAPDVLDGLGGVELALRSVKGLEGRLGVIRVPGGVE